MEKLGHLLEQERMTHRHVHGGCHQALRRHRSHQHQSGRVAMLFQILLNHHATHRMTNHDGRTGKACGDFFKIGDIVSQPPGRDALETFAAAMTAQTEGMGFIAMLGEVRQKVIAPDACIRKRAMQEQQRHSLGGRRGIAADHVQFHNRKSYVVKKRGNLAYRMGIYWAFAVLLPK